MLGTFLAIALLLSQPVDLPHAYVLADESGRVELAMSSGRFALDLGYGCDGFVAGTNVLYLAGSGGVGAIQPLDSGTICNVFVGDEVSDQPCATNDAGECDFALEGVDQ